MALLTEWEKSQIENIHVLIQQVEEKRKLLADKEKELVPDDGLWLEFRYVMFDLYSVLDYTTYLLYCHFSNEGQPDLTSKGSRCGFLYKQTGFSSDESGTRKKEKYLRDYLVSMFRVKESLSQFGEATHFWKETKRILEKLQPMEESENRLGLKIQAGDQQSIALLHYFRNCTTHRSLVKCLTKQSWVEINQSTREVSLVTDQRRNKDGFFYRDLGKGYWVILPEHIVAENDSVRLLLDIIHQLKAFVIKTSSQLLHSALLLPEASDILWNHIPGFEVDLRHKPSAGKHAVEAVLTRTPSNEGEMVQGAEPIVKLSGMHNQHVDAKEDACCQVLEELVTSRMVLPSPPYTHFKVPHEFEHFPLIQTLKRPGGPHNHTCKSIINELEQKLKLVQNLKVKGDYEGPTKVREQIFKTSLRFSISIHSSDPNGSHESVLKIVSPEYEEKGKDKAKEEAAAHVVKECARLGLIQLE